MSATIDKLRSYADLPNGWHYGRGGPIAAHVIQLAIEAEKILRASGYPVTGCFPGVDGEIQVCGYLNDRCLTMEVREETALTTNTDHRGRRVFDAKEIGFTLNVPVDHPEPKYEPKPLWFFR